MKNLESMPIPAQEPERLDVEEEDIEKAFKEFEDKRRAHAIEDDISETAKELKEKSLSATMEQLKDVNDVTLVKTEAASFAEAVVAKELQEASALLDKDPAAAAMALLKPVTERLQTKLDPDGGFDKPHGDPRVQELYDKMAADLKRDAIAAVAKSLKARYEAVQDGDPQKARIGRLIGLVEEQAQEKPEPKEEEFKPLAEELEPEPAAPPKKKGFFQRLLGR